jgi:hypothetical protein
MHARKQIALLVLTLGLAFGLVFQSQAASYPAPTKYKQTMVRVFTESQVSGWLETLGGRHFQEMAVSPNGAKIGFTVKLDSYSDKRLYVANADGTGLTDVTGSVPAGKLPEDVTSLRMNDTGTRLFFRDYPSGSIYYLDTASPYNSHTALLNAAWVDFRKPYTLDAAGNTLFLKHQVFLDDFWRIGLYSCPVGGTPTIVFNIDEIPHTVDWTLRYLGSGKGLPLFFTFDQDYWDDLVVPDFFMYKTGATPTKLPNETHQYIWDEQDLPNSIVSADGSKILYGYKDGATPRQLHLVDTATGAKSFILQTSSNFSWSTLAADASLARISAGGFKASRIDLKTLAARDTASSYFDEYGTIGASAGLSDITMDNRSYFLASKKAANNAAIHRIDMAPSDFSRAPNITNIAFNRASLPFDDTQSITVTAQLSDAKGLGNIQWVRILPLWDGVESPEGVIYMPLWFGSGDLYDDGSHGDLVAGDGIYTNNTITVQKWSEFYTRNRLPKKVGLRLIAKNNDSHYTIADTEFLVGNPGGPAIPALQLLLD